MVGVDETTGNGVGGVDTVAEVTGLVGVVVDGGTATSIGAGLLVDGTIGALLAAGNGDAGAVAPTMASVAMAPTAEIGNATRLGRRLVVGGACRGRAKPDSHNAIATQSVIGQNSIAAKPRAIPAHSQAALPGKRLANSIAMTTAVTHAMIT